MARVYEKLASWLLPRELEDIGLENTPQYDLYEDKTQIEQMFPQLIKELEPMQKVGDYYIVARILLPRWDEMVRGHVGAWSHDASGNVMEKPIQILYSIPEWIKLHSWGGKLQI